MVGRTLLHYTITAELGAGAMGRVYLARDTRTDRQVALKFLSAALVADPGSQERLTREARAASRLAHPGIVTLYSMEEADDQLFLIEEYVEGETLAQRLARGPVGPEEVLRMARELSAALAHAHARGVIHRDLKPENVLIGPDTHYKIADFGIAHVEGTRTLTAAGTLMGTLPYMAPELLRGGRGDERADLYALGAIFYEVMSGRRAIAGASEAEALYQVMNEAPAPLEPASPTLRPLAILVEKLLAKEPRERPQSASSVLELIERQPMPGERPKSRSWRARRRMIAGVAVVSVLALGGLLFAWRGSHRPTSTVEQSSLAVLYFENVSDPTDRDRIGPITSTLLITSLAQAEALHVLSTHRILDALVGLGQKTGAVDRKMALQVAKKLHAGRIVTGSVLQTSPNIVMTAEVSNVQNGEVVAATRIEGEPGQTVFQVVDALGARLLREMGRGQSKALETVALRASADLEAMKQYVQGLEQLSLGNPHAAVTSFDEAVRRDPRFAQAHFQDAIAKWWADDDWADAMASLERARSSADRLSPLERGSVEGLGLLLSGRYDSAAQEFKRLVQIYPGDKLPLYGLVEAYFHGGQWEQAIVAARRVLEVDPHFSPAATHLCQAIAMTGRWEEAERQIQDLVRANPYDALLTNELVSMRIQCGDGEGALTLIRHGPRNQSRRTLQGGAMLIAWDSLAAGRAMMLDVDGRLADARDARAHYCDLAIALHQGRFRAALASGRRTLSLIRERRHPDWDPPLDGTYRNAIAAALGAGDTVQALRWCDSTISASRRFSGPRINVDEWWMTMPTWIRVGRISEPTATLRRLESLPESRTPMYQSNMEFYRGLIEIGERRWPQAVDHLRRATATHDIVSRPYLARALMGAERYPAALALIDTMLRAPTGFSPDHAVRLRFERARVLEKLDRPAAAAQSYERFLYLWRLADPGTPEVEQAQAALKRLGPQ